MKKYFLTALSVLLLSSCEKEFTPFTSPYANKIVINSLFEQSTPITVNISNSVNVYGTATPEYRDNATIKLFRNNVLLQTITGGGVQGDYTSGVIPAPGETYKVMVSLPGFTDAEAENTMPSSVKISNWTYVDSTFKRKNQNTGMDDFFGDFTFTINDPPVSNKYLLKFYFYDDVSSTYIAMGNVESNDEALNSDNLATYLGNGEWVFSDNLFNGRKKTFSMQIPSGYYQTKYNYLIQLYNLSDDAYFYLYSQSNNTGGGFGGGFSQIYSNVKNGVGIFAGRSLEVDTIK